MATAIPFHRAVVADPAFAPRTPTSRSRSTPAGSRPSSSTTIKPFAGPADAEADEPASRETRRRRGRRQAPGGLPARRPRAAAGPDRPAAGAKPKRRRRKKAGAARLAATPSPRPMQGTIVKVAVEEGQQVAEGDLVVVLEAMKMEQPLNAHRAGTVKGLAAEVGASVTAGAVICEIKD